MEKEIRIEARVRNNRLYHAIFSKWPSVRAFCLEKGYYPSSVGNLLNLKVKPLTKKGVYNRTCKRLADDLGFLVDDLFPLPLYGIKEHETAFEVSLSQLPGGENIIKSLPDITENALSQLESAEKVGLIMRVLPRLGKQDVKIFKLRFGIGCKEHTIKGVGEKIGLSAERTRQLLLEALLRARIEYEKLSRSEMEEEELQASRERIIRHV